MYSLFHLHDVIGRNRIFNSCVFHVKFKNSCAVFSTIFSDTPMKQHLTSAKPSIDDKLVKFLQKFSCFGIFLDSTTSIGFFDFCRRGNPVLIHGFCLPRGLSRSTIVSSNVFAIFE